MIGARAVGLGGAVACVQYCTMSTGHADCVGMLGEIVLLLKINRQYGGVGS